MDPQCFVELSKKLSWLLRHGAESKGLKLDLEGFIPVSTILEMKGNIDYFGIFFLLGVSVFSFS